MMKMLLSSRWKGPSEFLPKMQGDKFEYIFFILIHILPRLCMMYYDVASPCCSNAGQQLCLAADASQLINHQTKHASWHSSKNKKLLKDGC
jgi:hypothetical protein